MRFFLSLLFVFNCLTSIAAEVSITIDDPKLDSFYLSTEKRDQRILKALDNRGLKAALFVCGMRVDSDAGKEILNAWSDAGHLIANHSYSHHYFHSKKISLKDFEADFAKNESLIRDLKGFEPYFRYPYLKEGDTLDKRDGFRRFLKAKGYRMGSVTIDASDWYVSQRLEQRLRDNPNSNLAPYRDFYLRHIWSRAQYYDTLSKQVLGRSVKHTLLIHHNLLNALFLPDLLTMFEQKGWKLINAKDAFADPVFESQVNILPAGESILWALAKEAGQFEKELRYPAEDGEYEREEMNRLGL